MALKEVIEKCKKLDPKIWIGLYVIFSIGLLYCYPPVQVSHFEINNATIYATLENQYRATLAQILGGGAVAIGIYFAWKNFIIAQENLKVAQKGQITERFSRAIDQLGAVDQSGNPAIEIRLGGIYALEGIANESEEYYWPIMEILTAYVRKNSPSVENANINAEGVKTQNAVSLDIQTILTVIGRRRYTYYNGELNRLDLRRTYLKEVNLTEANLEGVSLVFANLEEAKLGGADLIGASLIGANLGGSNLREAELKRANLAGAYLVDADLSGADLTKAKLIKANLTMANLQLADLTAAELLRANLVEADLSAADLSGAHIGGADFAKAELTEANLEEANLIGAKNLTVDQLSKVKTLYKAELDEGLEAELRAKGFGHLLDDEPKDEP